MNRVRRLLAFLLIAALGLVAPGLPATAATTSADRAGAWVATQVSGGVLDDGFDAVGATAEGLIGLAATGEPALAETAATLLTSVQDKAAAYATNPGRAAKLAIVAAAYGIDPTDFGGVDLVAIMTKGINADGSIGTPASAFTQGLVMVGLERSGVSPEAATAAWLAEQANTDGGFGYAAGQPSDPDSTALAILGLQTVDSETAKAALAKAVAWAEKTQQADGSWTSWVPVNSTALLGSALQEAGQDASEALAFVRAQQLANGAVGVQGEANLLATTQSLPFLGHASYLSVKRTPADSPSPAPTATPISASPSPAPTASASADSDHGAGRGVPAKTGDDEFPPAGLALGAAAVAAAGALLKRRA